jgi:hypothetical protein
MGTLKNKHCPYFKKELWIKPQYIFLIATLTINPIKKYLKNLPLSVFFIIGRLFFNQEAAYSLLMYIATLI